MIDKGLLRQKWKVIPPYILITILMASSMGVVDASAVKGGGFGDGTYFDVKDIPSDGLWYSIPFDAYVKGNNGFYIEDATSPRRLIPGIVNTLRTDNTKTTTQSITSVKGGRVAFNTELGPVLDLARRAFVKQGLFGMKKIEGGILKIDTEIPRDTITKTSTVTFNTTHQISVTPKNDRVQARAVYYKQANRSFLYRKKAKSNLEIGSFIDTDVAVAQGWILQCGDSICEPGV